MSKIVLIKGAAPATPPAERVIFYAKTDGNIAFKNELGEETTFATFAQVETFHDDILGDIEAALIEINGGA